MAAGYHRRQDRRACCTQHLAGWPTRLVKAPRGDVRETCKAPNAAFQGRGGGKPAFAKERRAGTFKEVKAVFPEGGSHYLLHKEHPISMFGFMPGRDTGLRFHEPPDPRRPLADATGVHPTSCRRSSAGCKRFSARLPGAPTSTSLGIG